MQPRSLPDRTDSEELTEHYTKLTIVTKQYVNNDLEHLGNDEGYKFENWKIEPFVGFKVTLKDKTQIILTTPQRFERFGISYFEQTTVEFEPEEDCNV